MKFNLRDIIDYDLGLANGRVLYVPLNVVEYGMQSLIDLYAEKSVVTYLTGLQDKLTEFTITVSKNVKEITEDSDTIEATTSIEVPNVIGTLNVSGVPVVLHDGVMYVHHDFVYVSVVLSSRLFSQSDLIKDGKITYDRARYLTLDLMYQEVVPGMLVDEAVESLKGSEDNLFLPLLSYPKVTATKSTNNHVGDTSGHVESSMDSAEDNLIINLNSNEILEESSSDDELLWEDDEYYMGSDDEHHTKYSYLTTLTVLLPSGAAEPVRLDIIDIPLDEGLIVPEFTSNISGNSSKDDYLIILGKSEGSSGLDIVSEIEPDTAPGDLAEILLELMAREDYSDTQEYIALISTIIDSDMPHGLEGHLEVPFTDVAAAVLGAKKELEKLDMEELKNENNNTEGK